MRRLTLLAIILGCTTGAPVLAEVPTALSLHADGANASLRVLGPDARRQLLATTTLPDGSLRDVTRDVTYEVAPAAVAQVDKAGLLSPLADGTA